MFKHLPMPRSSFIQWHITERCNLRCTHCYQTSYETPELPMEKLSDIFYQYIELLDNWGIKGRIQLTGGEPFIRKDELFALLEHCYQNRDKLKYSIMSNGFYVTRQIARKLKELGLSSFQVSIEGDREVNDSIRGKGSFDVITKNAAILAEEGLHVSFSITSSKTNQAQFREVADLGREIGASTVWSDRLVPWGVGAGMREHVIPPLELKQHYADITSISRTLKQNNSKTRIATGRTLYFLADCNCNSGSLHDNTCDVVGTRGVTILPDGICYSCRRLAVPIGDLKKQSLFEIWYCNDFMWKLRDKNNYKNSVCGKCEFFEKCATGSMCVTYGYAGTPFATDPQCWKAFKELPSPESIANDARKAAELAEEMKPEFWENIYVPNVKGYLGEFLEFNGNNLYLQNSLKMPLNKDNDFVKIRISELDEKILNKLSQNKSRCLIISLLFENLNEDAKFKVIKLFKFLKENRINYKLLKPLPKCLFGYDYGKIVRKFKLPYSIRDSIGLYFIKDKSIYFYSPLNIKGPRLKYLNDREQINELFEFMAHKLSSKKMNRKCDDVSCNCWFADYCSKKLVIPIIQ